MSVETNSEKKEAFILYMSLIFIFIAAICSHCLTTNWALTLAFLSTSLLTHCCNKILQLFAGCISFLSCNYKPSSIWIVSPYFKIQHIQSKMNTVSYILFPSLWWDDHILLLSSFAIQIGRKKLLTLTMKCLRITSFPQFPLSSSKLPGQWSNIMDLP